jgi:hypothetical protein
MQRRIEDLNEEVISWSRGSITREDVEYLKTFTIEYDQPLQDIFSKHVIFNENDNEQYNKLWQKTFDVNDCIPKYREFVNVVQGFAWQDKLFKLYSDTWHEELSLFSSWIWHPIECLFMRILLFWNKMERDYYYTRNKAALKNQLTETINNPYLQKIPVELIAMFSDYLY